MTDSAMTEGTMKVMLITGGTGSIGRQIAADALAAGWAVVIQGRSAATVATAMAALGDGAIKAVVADIKQPGATAQLVADAAACFGRLDAVVDCLVTGPDGGAIVGPFDSTDPQVYGAFMDLSIVYLQQLAFAALPWLKQSGGCLVAFASDAGIFAAPRQTLIAAARAATVGFVRNLALDVARDGVRVHCVSPSFVDDTATARKLAAARPERFAAASKKAGLGLPTPKDIAPLVLFLCGDGARRITGQVISINGGLNA